VPTTSATGIVDNQFAKRLVIVNGLVPAIVLAWDAFHHQLGVNEVNFAIRTTGLIGLVFLTLSLSVTPLRRLTGWNWLLAIRRNLGVFAFFYIACHFSIFFVWDRALSIGSTLEEIVERVYLWFGTASLLIMLALAITSTDGMVSRLGKRWKWLHRLTYLAIIGGVVHYYLLVKSDVRQPFVFGVVAALLLLYRIVAHYVDLRRELKAAQEKVIAVRKAGAKPKKKFWTGELRVARIFDETHDVKTFRFVSPDGGPLPFEHIAGQYINLQLMIDGMRVNRSYTIASSPTRAQYAEISVKRASFASKYLHANLHEGDLIKVSAPAGKFYFAGTEAKRVILVAGGVGITPMMSIVRSLTDRGWPGDMYLLFAVRKHHDVIFDDELKYLRTRFPNLHVHVTLTDDPDHLWDGARGRINAEMVKGFVPDLTHGPVMMCGPEPMMDAARAVFVALGVPDAEITQEEFASPPMSATPAAAESSMSMAAVAAVDVSDGSVPNVSFQREGKTAELGDLTILEAAEEAGVSIPFECRSGICGQCKTKLVSGKVTMEVQDALTAADRAKGLILACQAHAVRDVVVDA
jgi:glycine betaine catabolism B